MTSGRLNTKLRTDRGPAFARRKVTQIGMVWVVALSATSASAQYPQNRYRANTPTVSPYLNLLRTNTGGLPNYYSLVRPQLEFDASRRQQELDLRQQQQSLLTLQSNFRQTERLIRPTGVHGRFLDTGTRSGFMSQSHYFPIPNHPRIVPRR